MARLARVVAAGVAHHVTQRGNRRQQVFFGDDDYLAYRALLAETCAAAAVEVWAYCFMPNHVHLILVPSTADGLRAALGEAHRRYPPRRLGRLRRRPGATPRAPEARPQAEVRAKGELSIVSPELARNLTPGKPLARCVPEPKCAGRRGVR